MKNVLVKLKQQNPKKTLFNNLSVFYLMVAFIIFNSTTVLATAPDIGAVSGIFDDVVSFLAWAFGAVGVMVSLFGLFTLAMGISQDNANERNKGILAIAGGAIVIAIGVFIGTQGSGLFGM